MTVLLVLFFFSFFLTIDYFKTHPIHWYLAMKHRLENGSGYTIATPGFEALGAMAQDGGKTIKAKK